MLHLFLVHEAQVQEQYKCAQSTNHSGLLPFQSERSRRRLSFSLAGIVLIYTKIEVVPSRAFPPLAQTFTEEGDSIYIGPGILAKSWSWTTTVRPSQDGLKSGNSPLGDEKTHNKLVIALQLLNQINKQLTDVMHTGKLAAIQTDRPKFKIFG
jgi:hypothetical protein